MSVNWTLEAYLSRIYVMTMMTQTGWWISWAKFLRTKWDAYPLWPPIDGSYYALPWPLISKPIYSRHGWLSWVSWHCLWTNIFHLSYTRSLLSLMISDISWNAPHFHYQPLCGSTTTDQQSKSCCPQVTLAWSGMLNDRQIPYLLTCGDVYHLLCCKRNVTLLLCIDNSISCYALHRPLTHRGRTMHICVSKLTIICSDNGLSPDRHQAKVWASVGILLIQTLETNFNETVSEIHIFSFTVIHDALENAVSQMVAIWFRPQYVTQANFRSSWMAVLCIMALSYNLHIAIAIRAPLSLSLIKL